MGSASTKAGMDQNRATSFENTSPPSTKAEKRSAQIKRNPQLGAFGKSRSRKRARGAQAMFDRQLATLNNMKSKMRQPGDVSVAQSNLSNQQNAKQEETQRFALRGMKGSALAKIVEANKAKTKKHLK